MDGKWFFPHLNGVNNHALVAQIATLLPFKGFLDVFGEAIFFCD
jgi:hypothetical protein